MHDAVLLLGVSKRCLTPESPEQLQVQSAGIGTEADPLVATAATKGLSVTTTIIIAITASVTFAGLVGGVVAIAVDSGDSFQGEMTLQTPSPPPLDANVRRWAVDSMSPSPMSLPLPPRPPSPESSPPPQHPCLFFDDGVRLAISNSELVISNIGGNGPDFGKRTQIRYANGATMNVNGSVQILDVALVARTPLRVVNSSANGQLLGAKNKLTVLRVQRGTSVDIEAHVLPTCCQNFTKYATGAPPDYWPTCNFCDLHAENRASCYAATCCCKGRPVTAVGTCTNAFKARHDYSCETMDTFALGHRVPLHGHTIVSFFDVRQEQWVQMANSTYARSPLRTRSGNSVQSGLMPYPDYRFEGTRPIDSEPLLVDDADSLTNMQASNSVTFYTVVSRDVVFSLGSSNLSAFSEASDTMFQVGGETLLCAPPPTPPPSRPPNHPPPPFPPPPPSPRPFPPLPQQSAIVFKKLELPCGERVLQAQNLASVYTGGGLASSHMRTLYRYVGDNFLNSETNTYASTTWPHAFVPIGARLDTASIDWCATGDDSLTCLPVQIHVSRGAASNLLVGGSPVYQSTLDRDEKSAIPQNVLSFFFSAVDADTGGPSGTCNSG